MQEFDFSEIVGFYSSNWGIPLFHKIGDSILSINPGFDNPTEMLEIYKHEKDLEFIIPTTNPFGSPGETLKFEKDDNGEYQINSRGFILSKFEFSY